MVEDVGEDMRLVSSPSQSGGMTNFDVEQKNNRVVKIERKKS